MRDAFLCSELGVPSATVVTTPFQRLAHLTASALGAPHAPVMVIEHPIWTRDQAWMDAAAGKLAGQLLPVLFSGTAPAARR